MSFPPDQDSNGVSRKAFLQSLGALAAGLGTARIGRAAAAPGTPPPLGFNYAKASQADDAEASRGWHPISERKLRVGLVGYGVSKFSPSFSFQDHPNVEVVAVSDLIPERCAAMAKVARCSRTYPSLEELVKDDRIEAVLVCTDPPHHVQHCLEVLRHGKHVGVSVPATFGESSVEDAGRLLAAVKETGLKYMMFETSCFQKDPRADLHAMRAIYRAGGFGKLIDVEGEYYHNHYGKLEDSYLGWRIGLPPQWYPTHSNAYALGTSDETFTEVSCRGYPSDHEQFLPGHNHYGNTFATEIALYRLSGGGMARMAVSWDTPGYDGVIGRARGQRGTFYGTYAGLAKTLPDLRRPPIPPGTLTQHHGGSHAFLTNEFITAIFQDRKPLVDVATALNLSVAGFVAHQSAQRDGELLKIPQFKI